jgi:hypothetical protein
VNAKNQIDERLCVGAPTEKTAHRTLALIATTNTKEVLPMLQTLAIVLLVLWLLGVVSAYTLGGFIHILLVVAVVMFLIRFISGRKSP